MARLPVHHGPCTARTPSRPAALPSRALTGGYAPLPFFPESERPLSLVITHRFFAAAAGSARGIGASCPAG